MNSRKFDEYESFRLKCRQATEVELERWIAVHAEEMRHAYAALARAERERRMAVRLAESKNNDE